jgi:hypothetical protein
VKAPSWETQVGNKVIHLYDHNDVAELKAFASRIRQGRKHKS